MQALKDEEVMLRYKNGEVNAMDELLRRYKNPIYHFTLRLINDKEEALDITQEVFFSIFQHKDSYAPTGKFSTWIFSIAHNLAISKLRKKKWFVFWPRKADSPDELVEIEDPKPALNEQIEENDFCKVLNKCMQGLPFLQKEALVLREYQGMDYEEIARILKKPKGTIKTLIHRARTNLKIRLLPILKEAEGGCHE